MPRILVSTFLLLALCSISVSAQETGFSVPQDTVEDVPYEVIPKQKAKLFAGRPGKAALFSLALPGAGQAYNKKYWQVPIVWGAVGGMGYLVDYNTKQYKGYRKQFREYLIADMEDRPPVIFDSDFGKFNREQTRNLRDEWNRQRQLAIIGLCAVWVANAAQAFVSAHLKEFDIDDDLSFEMGPHLRENSLEIPEQMSFSIVYRF